MPTGGNKRIAAGKVSQSKTKGSVFVNELSSAFDTKIKGGEKKKVNIKVKGLM